MKKPLLALSGKRFSGKDTLAALLVESAARRGITLETAAFAGESVEAGAHRLHRRSAGRRPARVLSFGGREDRAPAGACARDGRAARATSGWRYTAGVDDHHTETELDDATLWDEVVTNDGSIDDLRVKAEALIAARAPLLR